ncbi:MAG TPA: hypothetical protein DCF84_03250 [Bacteroidetes bacterium]|nr:hypothetical protein [Bacteroidota bacterium]|tara:strand:- start:528 stop:1082 length:555 start_codon:yes stop_codon:yes gene_type:complete
MITNHNNSYISVSSDDDRMRFVLGKRGNKSLLVIGLNPSSANEKKLDPTTRIIEKIALNHGYDGWHIINLYPLRCAKPSHLPKRRKVDVYTQNLLFIEEYLVKNHQSVEAVCLGWGNHIARYPYLKEARDAIRAMLALYDFKWHCLGVTQAGHPIHPSPLSINTRFGGASKVALMPYSESIGND